ISEETIGSFVTAKTFLYRGSFEATVKASLTSSADVFFDISIVMSERDPTITGALMANPSKSPSSSGITSVVALAAPVVVGTRLNPAARARLKSGCNGGG